MLQKFEIPVAGSIGTMASQLADFHGDPADRIILATALEISGLPLTADKKIIGWGPGLHCQDASLEGELKEYFNYCSIET